MTEKTTKEKTIANLYVELNRLGQNGEYERTLKTANKILGLSAHEFLAFQCKIVSFIHLSKFDEAINIINKNPQFAPELIFEKAYCYYRVNKHTDALKAIDEQPDGQVDFRCKELKAQILYRIEEFNNAAQLYQEIIKNTDDDYEDERHTNLSAALVYLEDGNVDELPDNTYELCYNKACWLIDSGSYTEAEKKLRQCEKLCREYFEEDETTEDEINIELALIRIQLAFVYHKQGRLKEAHQLYTTNLKLKLEDVSLMAVASNNVVCINKDQNLFDSKKKMKVALNDTLTFKLPSKQRKYIALNNAIFNYYVNQTDQCEKICRTIDQTWPELSIHTTILKALNLVKVEKNAEAIKLLTSFTPKTNEDKLFVKLCIAQLHLVQGERLDACKVLEKLGEDSYKPGIVGALTTLYLGLGDEETALKVFETTVDWYKKNKIKSVDLSSLWRQAADFHIRNGHPQVAANSLEELLRANRDDVKISAQLVLACAQFDKQRAIKLSAELPNVKQISSGLDIDNLQTLASNTVNYKNKSPAINKPDSLPATPGTEDAQVRKRKHKKRRGKLPKNYEAGSQPDPERWLPRYERSGYRKKRDRRVKEVIKGSQGTASGQAEQYDFSKYVEEASEPSSTSTTDPSPKPKSGHFQPKKGQQKRKNKRR